MARGEYRYHRFGHAGEEERLKAIILSDLRAIKSRVEKGAYWNALACANDMQAALMSLFDVVLKRPGSR